jgi:hypothetical protein
MKKHFKIGDLVKIIADEEDLVYAIEGFSERFDDVCCLVTYLSHNQPYRRLVHPDNLQRYEGGKSLNEWLEIVRSMP